MSKKITGVLLCMLMGVTLAACGNSSGTDNPKGQTTDRSYYSVFYAVKAVLSLEGIDFKRHKDVIAYFNHTYVATEIIPRSFGRKIGQLQQRREKSDYDDFYIASKEEALEQLNNAKAIIEVIRKYLEEKGGETP